MLCAISDTVPEDPVFAVKTGLLYSRRLIEKAIEDGGRCPVSGEELSADDLTAVKAKRAVAPRPASATSIPGLLKSLQNEYDAQMLETFTLKKHLDAARQELSQALYQHDAACRVIARLVKERDEARGALSNAAAYATAATAAAGSAGDTARPGITEDVLAVITNKAKLLNKSRKKRRAPDSLADETAVAGWKVTASHSPHLASSPGITCLDMHGQSSLIATGGVDKTVKIFDLASATTISTLAGHSKKVTGILLHPTMDAAVSTSLDGTVRIWGNSGAGYNTTFTLKPHSEGIVGVSLHPVTDYIVTASVDKSWAFSNLVTGRVLTTVVDAAVTSPLSCIQVHPDGVLVSTGGDDGVVRMWDLKAGQTNVASLEDNKAKVNAIAFSENGYYVASGAEDGVVKIWDLRKVEVVSTLSLNGKAISSLNFDLSGSYLAVGGDSIIGVFNTSEWKTLASLEGHSSAVTGVRFGVNAASLVSSSLDKTIKVFA